MVWRIKLRQLEAFRGVMLSGTTKHAAELMNISQPAVSRLIQDLEEQLGLQLFDRLHGRLQPRAEAKRLFDEAEETLVRLDRLDKALRNLDHWRSPLRIMAAAAFVYGVMPRALPMLRNKHPDTFVSVRITARRQVRNWVEAQDFDVAVSMLPIEYPAANYEFLLRTNGLCVLPPDHPLGAKGVIHAADLSGEPFISLLPDTMARIRLDELFRKLRIERGLVAEVQTSTALCLMVEAGLGVGITDPFTAERLRSTGILVRPFEPAVPYEYGVLYPINRSRSQLVKEFAQIIREIVAPFAVPAQPPH
jgi:DNA-binding transcriptional LysR family regulator